MGAEYVTAIRVVLLGDDDHAHRDICVMDATLDDADGNEPSVDGVTVDLIEDGTTRPFVAMTVDGAEAFGRELLRVVAEARGAARREAGDA